MLCTVIRFMRKSATCVVKLYYLICKNYIKNKVQSQIEFELIIRKFNTNGADFRPIIFFCFSLYKV